MVGQERKSRVAAADRQDRYRTARCRIATAEACVSLLHRRRRVAAPAVLVSALLAAVTASGAGPTSAAPEHQRISPHGDRQLRAVVALVGTTGVTAPGVRVVGVLP